MFGFLKEICDIVDLPYDELSSNIKIHWFQNTIVLNDFKKMINYSNEEVVVLTRDNRLNILGKDIKIVQFSKSELVLKGKFQNVFCRSFLWRCRG